MSIKMMIIRYLKGTYANIFPLSTLRRFIADQIINWFLYIGYYGSIISTVTYVIMAALYFIGKFIVNNINIKLLEINNSIDMYVGYTGIGLTALLIFASVMVLLSLLILAIYDIDYSEWILDQQKYIKELEYGKEDIEAVRIPIIINNFERFSYKILPLASTQRYIVRILLGLLLLVTIIKFHIWISLLTFPHENTLPWFVKWMISIIFQILIFAICFPIYLCIRNSCENDWNKFKSQQLSAISHKD